MNLSRRRILLSSLAAAALAGCTDQRSLSSLPSMNWPDIAQPRPGDILPPPPGPTPPSVLPTGLGTAANPIPRSHWTKAHPLMGEINPMNGITRITLHHEGWTAVTFTDLATTAHRLESIRHAHRARGWADIGYHYVIDRAGRVWQGRDVRFQGAHVRDHNEHNLGIMCLGNFDIERPSDAQLRTLCDTTRYFRRKYNVPIHLVKTHQEINPTACPGKTMQPRIVAFRSNGYFA